VRCRKPRSATGRLLDRDARPDRRASFQPGCAQASLRPTRSARMSCYRGPQRLTYATKTFGENLPRMGTLPAFDTPLPILRALLAEQTASRPRLRGTRGASPVLRVDVSFHLQESQLRERPPVVMSEHGVAASIRCARRERRRCKHASGRRKISRSIDVKSVAYSTRGRRGGRDTVTVDSMHTRRRRMPVCPTAVPEVACTSLRQDHGSRHPQSRDEATASGQHLKDLARMAARWTIDNFDILREADPEMPESLNDRAQDNYRMVVRPSTTTPSTLFRVADSIGPTLLIDEADTLLDAGKELTGILNSGQRLGDRSGSMPAWTS
jgi:hypothetical protein